MIDGILEAPGGKARTREGKIIIVLGHRSTLSCVVVLLANTRALHMTRWKELTAQVTRVNQYERRLRPASIGCDYARCYRVADFILFFFAPTPTPTQRE